MRPLYALLLLAVACDQHPTAVIPPGATRADIEAREAPYGLVDSTSHVLTAVQPEPYPIHVYWTKCEDGQPGERRYCPGTDPREVFGEEMVQEVVDAIDRWAEVIAPSPRRTQIADSTFCLQVFIRDKDCGPWAMGDTLEAGFHLVIDMVEEEGSFASSVGDNDLDGLTDWGFMQIGVSAATMTRFRENASGVLWELDLKNKYHSALHEIGHNLGVGLGEHWFSYVENLDSLSSVMSDPRAVAAFNRLGGDRWTGPKVLTVGPASWHWERCLISQDIMSGGRTWHSPPGGSKTIPAEARQWQFITELTAASLNPGYRYNASTLRPARVDWPTSASERELCDKRMAGKGTM